MPKSNPPFREKIETLVISGGLILLGFWLLLKFSEVLYTSGVRF